MMDVDIGTSGDEESIIEEVSTVSDDGSSPISVDQVKEVKVSLVPDEDDGEEGGNSNIGVLIGSVLGVLAVSGCGILVLQQYRQKGQRQTVQTQLEKNMVSPAESNDDV